MHDFLLLHVLSISTVFWFSEIFFLRFESQTLFRIFAQNLSKALSNFIRLKVAWDQIIYFLEFWIFWRTFYDRKSFVFVFSEETECVSDFLTLFKLEEKLDFNSALFVYFLYINRFPSSNSSFVLQGLCINWQKLSILIDYQLFVTR